eukprot:1780706-Rhodomonas_salina.1
MSAPGATSATSAPLQFELAKSRRCCDGFLSIRTLVPVMVAVAMMGAGIEISKRGSRSTASSDTRPPSPDSTISTQLRSASGSRRMDADPDAVAL